MGFSLNMHEEELNVTVIAMYMTQMDVCKCPGICLLSNPEFLKNIIEEKP